MTLEIDECIRVDGRVRIKQLGAIPNRTAPKTEVIG